MMIPIEIYNYFKGYIVSKKVHDRSGTMGDMVPIRLIDINAWGQFYSGVNPMHENYDLLNYHTVAWLHVSVNDVFRIMESRSVGVRKPTDDSIAMKTITHGDIMIRNAIIPMHYDGEYMSLVDNIFQRSMAILGYYKKGDGGKLYPIKEIDVGRYEDWCYLLNSDISEAEVMSW